MEPKRTTNDLQQRILILGQQKLEEERLFQQIKQAVDRPPASKSTKKETKRFLPVRITSQTRRS